MDYQPLKRVHYFDIVDLFPPIPDDVPLGGVPYPKTMARRPRYQLIRGGLWSEAKVVRGQAARAA